MTKSVYYIDVSGTKVWRLPNSMRHREDGPALEFPDGSKAWYLYGELHRIDGPAVELSDGTKEWFKNDKRHREDGPAIENNGYKVWYLNGRFIEKGERPENWEELVNLYQIERIMND